MLDFKWKQRDRSIIEVATQHVCLTRHFFRFFTSEAAAYRRIEKLRKQGLLRLVGTVITGDSGRPQNVYCNSWKPKHDQLTHDLLLTDFLLCYPTADTLRGWAVNRQLRPDAEMRLDGYFYNIELDTGEQSYDQVNRRQKKYAGSNDFLLYVTPSEKRLEGLRKSADLAVRNIALFTTLAKVLASPAGEIWVDCQNERTSIVDSTTDVTPSSVVEKPVEKRVEIAGSYFNT